MEVNPEQLEKEFYEVMNGPGSTVDRLVNGINFFMDQGFTENVRYVFYENLMNLGLPINGNFNKFYQTFPDTASVSSENGLLILYGRQSSVT